MPATRPNARLEAFCDGVFAIVVTLLVIDIRIPATEPIESANALWLQLLHLVPAILAFVLSFVVILITWVNHHATLKLIDGSSSSFVYANGFLLLTVAFVPFPTRLWGEYVVTSLAAPAVCLYNAVLAAQGAAWILLCRTALAGRLTKGDQARAAVGMNGRFGYFALMLYSALAVAALWVPHLVAALTTATWIFWLVVGIKMEGAGAEARP
jgi:TMEM175 potassium channel family protein